MGNGDTGVSDGAVDLVAEIRGDAVESVHRGHVAICDGAGQVVEAWGNPSVLIYPRSSCKMVQALPLLESGAGARLTQAQLALACASHQGAAEHTQAVGRWLDALGMGETDLRCGAHMPYSDAAKADLIRAGEGPCQLHNNCSGKHAGFLMLARHLNAGREYVDPDHAVQLAVRRAFEEVTEMESPGFGIDGCSAPNFRTRLDALAGAMGRFAAARTGGGVRADAMVRLREAMAAEPLLVAGEGRACTDLMEAMGGQVAVKTGAEAVYVAIVPELERGVAVKIVDGGVRAAEAVIAKLLVRLGVLDAGAPVAQRLTEGPFRNCRGIVTGRREVMLT
ncbi:L-asparaginase II [Jannaschia seosinensis]|uniref:L-asparaginase II n=1 Tax=Jannaschia seosinensis TaxID=313367 RepID=A0A0M7B6K3_9RHOB|nr:asparaginase [Jannaschia seosinensis]CUH33972.1 L-asparaginase II [Jannaschia seosinensis]